MVGAATEKPLEAKQVRTFRCEFKTCFVLNNATADFSLSSLFFQSSSKSVKVLMYTVNISTKFHRLHGIRVPNLKHHITDGTSYSSTIMFIQCKSI